MEILKLTSSQIRCDTSTSCNCFSILDSIHCTTNWLRYSSPTGLDSSRRETNPLSVHRSKSLPQARFPPRTQPTLSCLQPDGVTSKPLYESNIINEYLEEAFPDHSPRLLPVDPYEKARARIWINFVTSRILPGFHRFLQFQEEDQVKEARREFLGYLKDFTHAMDAEGPFF